MSKKTPCKLNEAPLAGPGCPHCNRPFATVENRNRHIKQNCRLAQQGNHEADEMRKQLEAMQKQIDEIVGYHKNPAAQEAAAMQVANPAVAVSAAAAAQVANQVSGQVNGPLTQVTNNVNNVNNVNQVNNISVSIRPWGAALELTDGDVEAALASIPGLAGTPTLAEVVSTLIKLVQFEELRRTHRRKRGTST